MSAFWLLISDASADSTYHGMTTRTWSQSQQGSTGANHQASLGTIILNATVLEEQEWTEDAVELYFGEDWGWDRAHSLEGQATAQGTLYQAGSLSGETWSISSYAFDATGSSLETMASQYNSQVQIDTEYHDYTHLATTSHDRLTTSAFTLKERGTLLSSGTFVFTDYELTTSDTSLSTKSAETFAYRHTIIPPPPPLFGTSSWYPVDSAFWCLPQNVPPAAIRNLAIAESTG